MKVLAIAVTTTFLFLQSCSSDKKEETSGEINTEQAATLPENINTDSIQTTPSDVPVSIDQTAAPATKVATGGGMNPAHGEPGHRCDIAVGEPLSSPPGKTNLDNPVNMNPQSGISGPSQVTIPSVGTNAQPQPQISQPVPAPISTPAPAGKTAPGMNPPHGEPGHDCSIAVGAPLKK